MEKNHSVISSAKPCCIICLEENKELVDGDGNIMDLYQELISEEV